MTQRIGFSGLKVSEGVEIELHLSGYAGREIDDDRKVGQVTLSISNTNLDDPEQFETVIDFELPMVRVLAAALIALADWVDLADLDKRP